DLARHCLKAAREAAAGETADRSATQSYPPLRTLPRHGSAEARYNSTQRRASIPGIVVTRLAAYANNHVPLVGLELHSRKARSYRVHCDDNGTRGHSPRRLVENEHSV